MIHTSSVALSIVTDAVPLSGPPQVITVCVSAGFASVNGAHTIVVLSSGTTIGGTTTTGACVLSTGNTFGTTVTGTSIVSHKPV